jgi:hypothetical protein
MNQMEVPDDKYKIEPLYLWSCAGIFTKINLLS